MTIQAGQKIRATDLGVWQSHTPTLTNIAGTVTSSYSQMGDLVVWRCAITHTGAGAAGALGVSMPVTAAAAWRGRFTGLMMIAEDVSVPTKYSATIKIEAAGTSVTFWSATSAAGGLNAIWFNNAPATWAVGDTFNWTLIYQAG